MINYAICEISGKQYKVIPGVAFEVNLQKEGEDIEAAVLLSSESGKLNLGTPYLKEKLVLKRVENAKGPKIRVSKFHAKANYRKTIGYRSKITKVILPLPALLRKALPARMPSVKTMTARQAGVKT